MATAMPPLHNDQFHIGELSHQQFLALAANAVQALDWQVVHISEAGLVAATKTLQGGWGDSLTLRITDTIVTVSFEADNPVEDEDTHQKKTLRFMEKLEELKATTSPATLDEQYESLKLTFVAPELDDILQPTTGKKEKPTSFLSFLMPTRGYFITPVLIILNILVFIIMVATGVNFIAPNNESLLQWGANFRPMTLEGEWWRLLTSCFIHIGILHLLLNMYALLYIGALLEPLLGSVRFMVAYLLTGIAASTASLWWQAFTVSAGASGAIFGMYGVFLALLTTNLIEKEARQSLLSSIALFVGYNLLFGLKGGIDNAAHIGGLLSGAVIGYALIPALKKQDGGRLSNLTLAALTIIVIGGAYLVMQKIPNDIGRYQQAMNIFGEKERKALSVYNLPKNATGETKVAALRSGIDNWHSCDSLLKEVGKLQLPAEFKPRNTMLKQYVDMRLQAYRLLIEDFEAGTNKNQHTYEALRDRIDALIDSLNKPATK